MVVKEMDISGFHFRLAEVKNVRELSLLAERKTGPVARTLTDLIGIYTHITNAKKDYDTINTIYDSLKNTEKNYNFFENLSTLTPTLTSFLEKYNNVYGKIFDLSTKLEQNKNLISNIYNIEPTNLLFLNLARFSTHLNRVNAIKNSIDRIKFYTEKINNQYSDNTTNSIFMKNSFFNHANMVEQRNNFMNFLNNELTYFTNDYEPITTQLAGCINFLETKLK